MAKVEVEVLFLREAGLAYVVKDDEDGEEILLPKSQTQAETRLVPGRTATLLVEEWVARDRGLI